MRKKKAPRMLLLRGTGLRDAEPWGRTSTLGVAARFWSSHVMLVGPTEGEAAHKLFARRD